MQKISFNKIHIILSVMLIIAAALLAITLSRPSTTKPTLPDNNTPQDYHSSIDKGLSYLGNSMHQVSPLQWLLIDYLQRKFDLDARFAIGDRQITPPEGEQNAAEFKVHRRIAFPNELVSELPLKNAESFNGMTMIATYCDRISPPSNFTQQIQSHIDAGGYDLTHAAYSLERMKENGCTLPSSQETQLRQAITVGLSKIVSDHDPTFDLRYEAMAMLMHIGRHDLVQAQWMNQIVLEQQPDGGWKDNSNETESNDHTTMLALWALLEFIKPDAPDEPIIHRPSSN